MFPVLGLGALLKFFRPQDDDLDWWLCPGHDSSDDRFCRALYFRYRKLHPALLPSKLWDATLLVGRPFNHLGRNLLFSKPFLG